MAALYLSGTAWVFEMGLRVTLGVDHLFRTLSTGSVVDLDPSAVHFVTDRTVGNLAAHDGRFTIKGGECSPNRLAALLAASENPLDRIMDIHDLAAHAHLGKGWEAEDVISAYAPENEVVVAA